MIDGPVVQVEHVPQSHVAEKTVEIPQLDVVEKIVETPEIQTGPPKIESNSGMRSRSLTHQFCPLWRNWQRPPRLSLRNRVQQSSVEQTIANPAISLAEKIAEMFVAQT